MTATSGLSDIALVPYTLAPINRTELLRFPDTARKEAAITLLSRKADYALLILSHLYESETGGTARGIAEKFGISRAFIANILKELCQKGLVDSHRGVKGGYSLARPAESVSLAELLESIEDGFRLTMCSEDHDDEESCSFSPVCTVKGPMTAVHKRIIDVLRNVSLAELFDPVAPRPLGLNVISNGSCCSNKAAAVAGV